MHAGSICFKIPKTEDYFSEGAALLNLSVSTLNEEKSHDSQLFLGHTKDAKELSSLIFLVIHIPIKKIIIGNIQPAQDDPGTPAEGLLNFLT